MGVIEVLSDAMALSKGCLEGVLPAGDPRAELRPSGLSLLHRMKTPDKQDLAVRMGCCTTSDGFTEEGKMRVDTRAMSLRGGITHACFTVEVWLASADAAVASIVDVRAWEMIGDTGFVRSLHMVRRLRTSADGAISTKEGTTCLLPITTMASGLLLSFSQELEPSAP